MSSLDIKSIIEQVDLVDFAEKFTSLSPSGSQFRGVCPICHHGNESEFVVYNHRSFHCFVCGASGDVINLIEHVNHVDFFSAVELLADELNIDVLKDPNFVKRKSLSNRFKSFVSKAHSNLQPVLDYLIKQRGLSRDTINFFELGANDRGDVVIPFVDSNNRYVGVALRKFEGNPKYVNSKNNDLFSKAEFLFNLRGAKALLKHTLFLVEGYFCAMTLHQQGLPAVSYNSSQVSKQQCAVLQKLHSTYPNLTVVLVPDNDGVAFPLVSKSRQNFKLAAPDVPVEVLVLPDGAKDVNDLFTQGRFEEFKHSELVGIDEFVLEFELDKCSSKPAERKIVEKFVKDISDPITLDGIADFLSDRWQVEKKIVRDFLKVSQNTVSLADDFKTPIQCFEETRSMLTDPRLQYGITALDQGLRGGGRRKDVTFIGASAGAGKTFLTVQMCVDMVVRQRKNAVYFSMEMSAGALYERVLSNLLGKDIESVDRLIRDCDPTVGLCLDKLKEHLYIVDKNGLNISQIDSYVKEANATLFDGNLDVVFIDYIQYMRGCTEYQVLAETAKGMKPLAKDNNIHVIVISQLNRGSRTWEKPDLGDLKGGGDLEASADNVFLMWRPASHPKIGAQEFELTKHDVKLCIAKARNGSSINEITLVIDPDSSRMRLK